MTKGFHGGRVTFQAPVLMKDTFILGLVEPHKAKSLRGLNARKQIRNLRRLPSDLTDSGLRQENWLFGKCSYLVNGGSEGADKCACQVEVVAVDSNPCNVVGARPPFFNQASAAILRIDSPQPGNVA